MNLDLEPGVNNIGFFNLRNQFKIQNSKFKINFPTPKILILFHFNKSFAFLMALIVFFY